MAADTRPDTLIFDPAPCGFPKPRVPLLPVGFDGIGLGTTAPWARATHFRRFSRGRYALREAYRLAGIRPVAPAWKDELRGIAHIRSKATEHHHSLDLPTDIPTHFTTGIDRRESSGTSPDYRTPAPAAPALPPVAKRSRTRLDDLSNHESQLRRDGIANRSRIGYI